MMIALEGYVRRGRRWLKTWALDPRFHLGIRLGAYFLTGFFLSAASLSNLCLSLSAGFCCAASGWPAVLAAAGGCLGYLVFWGSAGYQGCVWLALALGVALVLPRQRFCRDTPLLLPAVAALIVSATGVVFQAWFADTTPVFLYLTRVGLGSGACWVFSQVLKGRNPILEWLGWGLAVLALAQVAPFSWLSFGCIAGAALAVTGAFPAAAMAGLALDLSGITAVPMTAVLCAGYLPRFLPRCPQWLRCTAPVLTYLMVQQLTLKLDLLPLPGLLLGGLAGLFLPQPTRLAYRRGETAVAQLRLEIASGVLAQTEQLLLEAPVVPVDEDALVARAAELACSGCPCRKSCKDSRRIAALPSPVLHKPLLTPEELPIQCRKSGRFLAQLHRSQEQLRSIRADRERQQEYRAAVIQQFQFLSMFLRELSDQLSRRPDPAVPGFQPSVRIYTNRPEGDNGDRCILFPGVGSKYYVLLCDGMGTGLGAVQEGKTALNILKRLLTAGYPAEYALRSLNSLCALRERAGAVTVDLAEIMLDTGKTTLYKWGAAPSYLITRTGAEKLGIAGPPPGLSVTDCRETVEKLSLRTGELLVMVSDGVGEEEAMVCCQSMAGHPSKELATALLSCGKLGGIDDATVVLVQLTSGPPAR